MAGYGPNNRGFPHAGANERVVVPVYYGDRKAIPSAGHHAANPDLLPPELHDDRFECHP